MKKQNLKLLIEEVLKEKPKARDSDQYLTLCIWNRYYSELLFQHRDKLAVTLENIMLLPREDNIKRIRCVIQNEENRFLPTSEEVAKQRKMNIEKWKQFLSTEYLRK